MNFLTKPFLVASLIPLWFVVLMVCFANKWDFVSLVVALTPFVAALTILVYQGVKILVYHSVKEMVE